MTNTVLRLPDVKTKTGLSRSAIYLLIAQGEFPKQVKLGARASGWVSGEIDQWINGRIAQRNKGSDNHQSSGQ